MTRPRKIPSQAGFELRTSNCLSRSVPEIHKPVAGTLSSQPPPSPPPSNPPRKKPPSAKQCMKSGDLHLALTQMPAFLPSKPESAAALYMFIQISKLTSHQKHIKGTWHFTRLCNSIISILRVCIIASYFRRRTSRGRRGRRGRRRCRKRRRRRKRRRM